MRFYGTWPGPPAKEDPRRPRPKSPERLEIEALAPGEMVVFCLRDGGSLQAIKNAARNALGEGACQTHHTLDERVYVRRLR